VPFRATQRCARTATSAAFRSALRPRLGRRSCVRSSHVRRISTRRSSISSHPPTCATEAAYLLKSCRKSWPGSISTRELASRSPPEVLLNGALIRDISRTEDAEERSEKIDNALIKSAEHLHERLEAISRSETEQREAVRAAEAEKLSSKQEVEQAYARIHELERALEERQAAEAGLKQQLTEAERRQDEAGERAKADDEARSLLEERIAETEKHVREQRDAAAARADRNKALRWIGAGILWAGSLLAVTLLLSLNAVTDVWPIVGVLLGALVLACLGIGLVFGWVRAWKIFGGVAVVIGLAAAVQQIAASADGNDAPTSPKTERRSPGILALVDGRVGLPCMPSRRRVV
jgi:hypothetical protein